MDELTGKISPSTNVKPINIMTKDQVKDFCQLKDATAKTTNNNHPHEWFARLTTVTTGIDVIWKEDDTGSPEEIFFGCWGQEGGNGNFGTINGDGKISQALHGAYPGAVIFAPPELVLPAQASSNKTMTYRNDASAGHSRVFLAILIWLGLCLLAMKKGRLLLSIQKRPALYDQEEQISLTKPESEFYRLGASYVELSSIEIIEKI
jgi:hypothetical protein